MKDEKGILSLFDNEIIKEDYVYPGLYHTVLNTSRVDIEKACTMVCDLVSS